MRVICEQILGLRIDYSDSVIYIANTAKLTADLVSEAKAKIGMFVKVASLEELKATDTYRNNMFYVEEMLKSEPESVTASEAVPGFGASGVASDSEAPKLLMQ